VNCAFNLRRQAEVFTEAIKRNQLWQNKSVNFFAENVSKIVRTDGLKLILDDGFMGLLSLISTEPVVRV